MLIPVVLAAIYLPQTPVPWLAILVGGWALLALYEFYHITIACGAAKPLVWIGLAFALVFIVLPLYSNWANLTQVWLSLTVVVTLMFFLGQRDRAAAFADWAWTLAGVLYLGWLPSQYVALRKLDSRAGVGLLRRLRDLRLR